MNLFANVVPVQKSSIPWGWKNRITAQGTFVTEHPGHIHMPELTKFFDWNEYVIEEMALGRDFGTRNMKSIFTTAARFLDWEHLLLDQPDLSPITDGFLRWNAMLADVWDGKLKWFMLGDDIAWNHGLVINPDWYRSWIKPQHQRLIDFAHGADMRVIFHSDGDIYALMDDFIDMGVDVLNYQSVGRMERITETPELISFSWTGHVWKELFCVESEGEFQNSPLTWLVDTTG
jgi:hypothetical protein